MEPIYLDCNATTPIEPEVAETVIRFMVEDFGNAGSRTHDYGNRAKRAVNSAREKVAAVVNAHPEEVVFTSGATESNNLAVLGLRDIGEQSGKKHIISTEIEHKAVLEPLQFLAKQGFEIELIRPDASGAVTASSVEQSLRDDTLLVSVMHVNNETGIIQPIGQLADLLAKHDTYFHVDAAQGFGKRFEELKSERIDMMSVSGHKIYGPKGIGALIVRRRGHTSIPLRPLMYGGGQERSLRPGTLPVELIVGLGAASELSVAHFSNRRKRWLSFRQSVLDLIRQSKGVLNGSPEMSIDTSLSFAIPGVNSEALMVALKDEIALSNGSACTSSSYEPSHVLKAMGLDTERIRQSIRLSWCHMTETPDWERVVGKIHALQS